MLYVVFFVLGKTMNKESPCPCLEKNHGAVAARLTLSGSSYTLLNNAAAQICINQALFSVPSLTALHKAASLISDFLAKRANDLFLKILKINPCVGVKV